MSNAPWTLAFRLALALAAAASPAFSQLSVSQLAYLKASNTEAGDGFGYTVAVSGNTVAIGAISEDSSSGGVNNNQADNGAVDSGAVYVFVRSGTSWIQQAYLKADNPGASDLFGRALSLSGDTLVVGAPQEDSSASGVDGDGSNNGKSNSGAAYVFVRNGATWTQQAYLKASNTDANDSFGSAVSVSGDTVVVGAEAEDSIAKGIDGDQSSNVWGDSGAAYVFVRNGTTWSQQAYIKSSNSDFGDAFGRAVSISGDTLAVTAGLEDSAATGVNGDQLSGAAGNSGAAYVFVRNGSAWSQQAYLKASNTGAGDGFGDSVAVTGDTLVIGAHFEDSNGTGVNGVDNNNLADNSGAAYVFVRSGSTWSQQAYLKPTNTSTTDFFGWRVAASGDAIVVGAYNEDSNATGVNGDQVNGSASNSGAAYVFVRTGMTTWTQQAYLKASNTGTGDQCGWSVGVSTDIAVMGATLEDSKAKGIDGLQSDNSVSDSGAAYAFALSLDAWTDIGSGLAGVSGVPQLAGSGTLAAGSPGAVTLTAAAPSAPALLFLSFGSSPVAFKCGTLIPVPWFFTLALGTSGAGSIALPWASWPGGLSGFSLYWQYAVQDAAAPCGTSLSNALRADVP